MRLAIVTICVLIIAIGIPLIWRVWPKQASYELPPNTFEFENIGSKQVIIHGAKEPIVIQPGQTCLIWTSQEVAGAAYKAECSLIGSKSQKASSGKE